MTNDQSDLLLDTCAAIWISNGDPVGTAALQRLREVEERPGSVWISAITAWEVATLIARNRLSLALPVERWFDSISAQPQTIIAGLSPEILIRSTSLPGRPPSDPADRMIIATARQFSLTILTRDRQMLAYAAQGHVAAMEC